MIMQPQHNNRGSVRVGSTGSFEPVSFEKITIEPINFEKLAFSLKEYKRSKMKI